MLKCHIVGNHMPQLICDMDVAGKQFVLKQVLEINVFFFYFTLQRVTMADICFSGHWCLSYEFAHML